jgi:hypothetical protein
MKFDLNIDEKLIRDGGANMQRGLEAVGGRLYLTNQRLVFESHKFNVQTGAAEIPLDRVTSVRPCWTKFMGVLPLFPNSLAVTVDQTEHRFVLFGRQQWAAAISAQLS